ncbi:MAG: hypothetical protein APR63_09540 [Desulfuromonas sp. SDB]|nr:MAG: hypothetical protein APR63_09540 [Desulfuromonas sp. SDB]
MGKTIGKDLHTAGGKKIAETQHTLKGNPVSKEEEFMADMTDPLGEGFYDGELVAMDDVINSLVTVSGFDRRDGAYGPYYTIHIEDNIIFNCGSKMVMERLDKVEDQLPLEVVFIKKVLPTGNRMYSVVSKATFLRMEQAGELK